jgi:hypothetical protein
VADFDFYELVRVAQNAETIAHGVANEVGPVLGITDPDDQQHRWYAVMIHDSTHMFASDDLVSTGERIKREDVYDGTSVRVSQEGHVVDGPDEPGTAP